MIIYNILNISISFILIYSLSFFKSPVKIDFPLPKLSSNALGK